MPQCIIHNIHGSNFGNLMIKFLTACEILTQSPNAILSNYHMPYWGISHPPITDRGDAIYRFSHDQIINLRWAAQLSSSGLFSSIELKGHYQRMENLPSASEARNYFNAAPSLGVSFGEKFIVCPVRAGETLTAIHSGYTLIPVNFYQDIFRITGLIPVFCGQTHPNLYVDELRRKFPDAIFLPPQGELEDFQTIRNSRNIIVPISTFAWIASWLSNASQIFLPVFGLFNPEQFPEHDLLPLGDERYRFFKFPVHHAVPVEDFMTAHYEIEGAWNEVPPRALVR